MYKSHPRGNFAGMRDSNRGIYFQPVRNVEKIDEDILKNLLYISNDFQRIKSNSLLWKIKI